MREVNHDIAKRGTFFSSLLEQIENKRRAMAGRRTGRTDMPRDPAAVVRALRSCRSAMIDVCRTVKPMGPAYHAASMVISAIDGFAVFLTGERYYFSADGSSASEARQEEQAEREARERGEKPWDR